MTITLEMVKRRLELSNDRIDTFLDVSIVMTRDMIWWSVRIEMDEFLFYNKDSVMRILRKVCKRAKMLANIFRPLKPVVQLPVIKLTLVKRLDKPDCNKGMSCINKTCTFIHLAEHPLAHRNNVPSKM